MCVSVILGVLLQCGSGVGGPFTRLSHNVSIAVGGTEQVCDTLFLQLVSRSSADGQVVAVASKEV